MNAYEYFTFFFLLRVVLPLVVTLAISEWARRHEPFRFGEK
jgi:hypothetical protein